MPYLTVNMWESDNVEMDFEITKKFYTAILRRFRSYCRENDYDIEDSMDDRDAWEAFFDDVQLEDIDEKSAAKLSAQVEQEVRRSIRDNWNDPSDPDGWQQEFESCTWGFFPVIAWVDEDE